MSVRALSWSFALPLQDMAAKGVLHALADHADEDLKCWPSLARIALFVGCSENTARRALQRVEAMGIISRETRPGQSDMYRLNADFDPSQIDTPTKSAPLPTKTPPLPRWDPTPPKLVGDPSHGGTRTVNEPSKNRQLTVRGDANAKPHRLPADWQPSQDCREFASDLGLDADATAEAFIDYWTGKGAGTKRTDWARTWRVWCRRETARPMGKGSVGRLQSTRGNDAFYQQLADIARRADD
jgi:hypothetical protein